MHDETTRRLQALRSAVDALAKTRYGEPKDSAEVEEQAAMMGDVPYFQARLRLLEAERDAASLQLAWMAPARPAAPKEALARIKAICAFWPDLYDTVMAVLATHQAVPRDVLATAIKQFRRDADAYSVEDMTGLLISAWNGGRHGFDAVLRSRKASDRKAAALPWGRGDD